MTLRADVVKDGRRALLKARSVAARPLLDDGERGVTLQPVGGRALILVQLDSCYGPENLQHLMHVDNHAVGVAGGGADEQVFHQPAVFGGPGLEPWHGAEID